LEICERTLSRRDKSSFASAAALWSTGWPLIASRAVGTGAATGGTTGAGAGAGVVTSVVVVTVPTGVCAVVLVVVVTGACAYAAPPRTTKAVVIIANFFIVFVSSKITGLYSAYTNARTSGKFLKLFCRL
jgi:hypothetical protein